MQYTFQKNNINPVHKDFASLGSSTSFGAGTNPLTNSTRAFQNLRALGNSTSFSAGASSGFQYAGVPAALLTKASAEAQPGADTLTIKISKFFTEAQPGVDFLFTGHKITSEAQPGGDTLTVKLTKYFTEAQPSADKLAKFGTLVEASPGADKLVVNIVKYFVEAQPSTDSEISFYSFDVQSSTKVAVEPAFVVYDSATIDVTATFDSSITANLEIVPNSLAAVTNPSSLSNPFLPTVISGGVTYLTNACTAPPPSYTITPQTYYVQYLNSGIGNTTFCDMTNSNLTIDYLGGNFSISSQNPLGVDGTYQGNLSKQVTAYGLQGTITDWGQAVSSNQFTYVTDGIFGPPLMNKQFTVITSGNSRFLTLINDYSSPGLQISGLVEITGSTPGRIISIKGVAQAIAQAAGATLSWLITDGVYTNVFNQTGVTALEALGTLASQMGGQLRWDGGNHYTVAYPNYYTGTWTVPASSLLTASGISYKYHQDLAYGINGAGVLGIPTNLLFGGTPTIPSTDQTVAQEAIQKVATVTKAFTSSDPALIIDLANDVASAKIQILVPVGQNSGGQYVTDDPTVWYDLGSPGISNPYVKINKVGNAYVNQLVVDYTLFPNLAAINNGNFVMSLGVTKNSLSAQFSTTQAELDLQRAELQAKIAANIRFIKTYTGSISCYFFGSLPLPGMWASATYCGVTVQGIVESVNISGTGIVTINVAQYFRINFNDAILNWDLTSGNYTAGL